VRDLGAARGIQRADVVSCASSEEMAVTGTLKRIEGLQRGCARWSPIPLRLMVGFGFMQHGFAKLMRGPDAFATILAAMHVPMPHLMAWLTILTELLGGLAVFVGSFIALASVPMIAVLLVAIFTVHLQYGFSSIKLQAITPNGAMFGQPGYECSLLYVACLVTLVLSGAGPLSVDGFLRQRDLR
jgi:putative oxidoreductase